MIGWLCAQQYFHEFSAEGMSPAQGLEQCTGWKSRRPRFPRRGRGGAAGLAGWQPLLPGARFLPGTSLLFSQRSFQGGIWRPLVHSFHAIR